MSSPAKRAEDSPVTKARFDFLDLRAQFATIHDEVMQAVAQVFESQYFILGPEVKLLEDEVAAKLGAKYAVGCASGTDALILSLLAADIRHGDEVITTPFSFIATAGAIAYVGAKPVFVDIDPVTYNLNPALLEAAITPDTRAIMPVHLFGLPADMDPILAVARGHNLVVIEDAAQAIGSRYGGRYTGTFGEYGCFSFFPSKNLGGAGDGGMITTNDAAIAERLQMLRVHGSKQKYFHEMIGTNSRLHALQAAVLRVKLRHLDAWQQGRQNRAQRYRQLFESAGLTSFVAAPPPPPAKFEHVYNQFTIRSSRRDDLKASLQAAGVPSEIYYPLCIHLQKAFAYLGHRVGDFPESEKASREVLSLPVYPELPDSQQDRVVQAIGDFRSAK
ncbi:MAG TPA: DegT/DnrJ/EryC1/StrS family aminotransferase [Candidatus Baltobacteraceae bacterium]|nr:DegT/DnrJ/EryC1/StrS family aminotransferase [Candidatus Baltobacteraceae bacterium]